MLTYQEFAEELDNKEDLLIELGEFADESVSIQSEYLGVITYDRAAEMYAQYLQGFGIFNAFIGVENSDGDLQMLQVKEGVVIYKVRNPLEGFQIQLVEEEAYDPVPSFVGQDGEIMFVQEINPSCTLVHCEGNPASPFEFTVKKDAEDFIEMIAAFRMRDRLEKL